MPKYKNIGTGMVRYGGQPVYPGDTIEASAKPGKNFALVLDTGRKATTFSTESKAAADVSTEGETSTEGKPGRRKRTT